MYTTDNVWKMYTKSILYFNKILDTFSKQD